MLNLSNNKITELECLTHLSQLAFLDMSSNLIQSYNPVKDLPKSIIILRMAQNPFEQEDPKAYRKQSVLALEYLTEIDKIKVI
jgi:Leucine-rich repeat (LRR) protein